jgi:prophage antirepressor-like protein
MKEIVRTFNGHEVRVIIQKRVEWFVARDVCDILEIRNVSDALNAVQEKHKTTIGLTDSGSNYKTTVLAVDEPGLYRLIFKSRKPEAERFQEWVYEEVLPAIRKTGRYEIPKNIQERSTENRNLLTGQWKRQGVSKPVEYGSLTKASYHQIFDTPHVRKACMDRSQILKLTAFESVEAWKLSENPENSLGFCGCRESISETAGLLEAVRNQNRLRSAAQV